MNAKRPNEAIAIIGTGLRLPGGANTPTKLWELLREPRDVQRTVPSDRFDPDGFHNPTQRHRGTGCTRHGYFLSEDPKVFDAEFFGIKPVEANSMDPQQRILLEVIYEGLEAAGLPLDALRGSPTAVYVGLMAVDYNDMLNRDPSDYPQYAAGGTSRSMISNRVSYFFDWRGPSMTIDTACSSSLVAVHQAVQSLRSGESRVAVAAGANLVLGPETFVAGSDMNMLSPDGRSYMWDSRANGYARGEGFAAIIMKTLSAAIADGDDIECVIAETAINQDGRTKGLTVPSAAGQTALIQTTYAKAGLDLTKPSDRPQYFEAHGTGTPAGDPIEAQAVQDAFFKSVEHGPGLNTLYCGSAKTVIGHTEGTAGLAGLIKASLAIKNSIIPPNLLFESLAPAVEPFYKGLRIPTAAIPWPSLGPGSVRRASVNSFGFGGTNAHCILENYDTTKTELAVLSGPYQPFVFSAMSKKTLLTVLRSYMTYISTQTTMDFRALSHTLCARRTSHPFRVSLSAKDPEELRVKLESILQEGNFNPTAPASSIPVPVRILGIFTGQGAQWSGMARALMQIPAAVHIIDSLEHSLATLQDPPSWSLKAEISADASSSRVTEAAIAQPACTAVQILLVEVLRTAGIHFSTVVGHSSGEIAAAYAAGRLSSKDAIRIAYYRGVHLPLVGGKNGERGAMVAIGASYEEAQEICEMERFRGKICVAACNSAASVTLSGDITVVEAVKDMLQAQSKFARLLRVDNAYHSNHMIRCSEAITKSLRACGVGSERLPRSDCQWISSVDVKSVTDDLDHLDYWHRNTIGCVFFSQALTEALNRSSFDLAVEVGAHPALRGPALQVIEGSLGSSIPYTGMLIRGANDAQACSDGVGYIWANLRESVVDFAGFSRFMNTPSPLKVLKNLPPYSWNHERTFWYESRISRAFRYRKAHHELLGVKTPDYSEDRVAWKHYIGPKELPWLSDHRIQGQLVFPGSGYIISAIEAVRQITTGQPIIFIELTNFQFGQALVFDSEDSSAEVLISLNSVKRHKSTITANFTYHSAISKDLGAMALNAECQLHIELGSAAEVCTKYPEQYFGMTEVNQEQIYSSLANCGYHYTGPFKALHAVQRRSGFATGLIQTPEVTAATGLLIHPATLDAAMHSIAVASSYPGDGRMKSVMLPVQVAKIAIYPDQVINNSKTQQFRFESYSRDNGSRTEGDVDLIVTGCAASILRLEGLRTKRLALATPADDVPLFSKTVWGPAFPTVSSIPRSANGCFAPYQAEFDDLVALAQQISHRYPSMNILGLGKDAGNAAKSLLLKLGNAYGCYTYTDTTEKSLNSARDILEPHVDKIVYKVLDIDLETTVQGYIDASYDLVVTFSTPDNTSQLSRTLKIARRLLKPGGYFLAPSLLNAEPRIPRLSLHHDVRGGKEHRRKDSMASPSSDAIWVQTLEECSFADVDLFVESVCESLPRCNTVVLQALDSRIQFLCSPLSSPKQGLDSLEVTLVGGTKSSTAVCCSGIVELLQARGSRVSQLEAISRLTDYSLPLGGNVVVLQDHDQPLFENLDEPYFKGVQALFESSKNILWVTNGYKGDSPHARMLVGFMRSLILEMSHVRLQILDITSPDALDATLIAEHLLRLVVTGRWEDENHLADILWTTEPEIAYEDNQYFIPRVKLNKLMNDRHNSAHRLINLPADPLKVPVTVVADGDSYFAEVREMDRPQRIAKTKDHIMIRVTHSFLKAVRITRFGNYFLVLGIEVASDKQVIALSSTLCSMVEVSSNLVRACDLPLPEALLHYRALFYSLITHNMLHSVALGQSLLVLEPSRDFANVLATFAAAQDIEIIFWTTANIPKPDGNGCMWKRVPTRATKRDLTSALSRSTLSQVISWGENWWATSLRDMIPNSVPINALEAYMADCGAAASSMRTESTAAILLERVQNWLAGTKATLELANEKPILLADLHTLRPAIDGFNILDWSIPSTVPARLKPTDQQTLFCPGKAYWLVGLTGDLGLSLCQWMISRGATHIVLSSRNPSIDNRWLAHFESLGAVIKVLCCDITDYSSVQATHDQIKASVGSIAGVCHGAMVLHDALFLDLDLAKVQKVLKPKVDGAINLDKVFQNEKLDFFVMLSSIAAVTGNPGQSAYAAGNGFLSALAIQRRKQGNVASCVALGAILGCGYVTRGLTLAQQESLQRSGVMWTSEQDFHSAFAEAVMAGPPSYDSSGDFTTGVRVCYTDEKYRSKHASNPVFSHLMLQRDITGGQSAADLPTTSLKVQLLLASTEEETAQVLESWLSSKLRKALQMPADATVIEKTAETLGIDSLIAVEVKSWLMKELNVGMPILAIIGGATMRELVLRCIEVLDPAMTQNEPRMNGKMLVKEESRANMERVSQDLLERTSRDKDEQALTERTKLASPDRSTTYQKADSLGPLTNVAPAKVHTVEPFDSEEKKRAVEQNSSTEFAGLIHRVELDTSNDASKSSSEATPSCSGSERTRSSHQPEAKDNNVSVRTVLETAPKSRLAKIRRIFSKRLHTGGKKSQGLLKAST